MAAGLPSLMPRAIREMAVRGFTGKRRVTRSIPDRRTLLVTACYSVLISQAGCNGRVTSPPFFFFLHGFKGYPYMIFIGTLISPLAAAPLSLSLSLSAWSGATSPSLGNTHDIQDKGVTDQTLSCLYPGAYVFKTMIFEN